ncbi:hypothetical protein ABIE33_006667 [Ensifer sp. 4252]
MGHPRVLIGAHACSRSCGCRVARFTRYSRDQSFSVLGRNKALLLTMAAGSILGMFIGGRLLEIVSNALLLPFLTVILLISAWRSGDTNSS